MSSPPIAFELPDEVLEQIAQRAAGIVAERSSPRAEPWLDVEGAAAHLGVSVSRIYELSHRRRTNHFPVTKDGSRSYFKASALDAWRARR